jgi:unsaturated rhamnogalacturonyl hydrolase
MWNGVRRAAVAAAVGMAAVGTVWGQAAQPVSTGIAADENNPVLQRVLREWPQGKVPSVKHTWSYEEGTLLDGVTAEWHVTGDGRLFNYVKSAVDRAVDKDGAIHVEAGKDFPADEHTLDNIEMGRSVMLLYQVTEKPNYYKAATYLHDLVLQQPKNASGGYWHKEIYPDQMWLDGAYMAEPFMASYARVFKQPQEMDGVATQLLLMDAHMRDRQTGLLKHGWDASGKMPWANAKTGLSPEVWSRAMGWYAMALVDVLEQMPASDPQRAALEDAARRALEAVAHYQDPATGLWWQVMDKGGQKGNFLEASASCMFVYALAKGVREGVVPLGLDVNATHGWEAIQKQFVKPDGTLSGTVLVAGLGGTPYRSGTYEYYVHDPVGDNDAKGVGAYLLALSEMTQKERAGDLLRKARGKVVMLDAWFNAQHKKLPNGKETLFHYKWTDEANSGYSVWGSMFRQYGMETEELEHAPRSEDLRGVSIYVIVSPDIQALNPDLHPMDKESADAIEAWVKAGGVLMLMENDAGHANQASLDLLSDRFGVHFNTVSRNLELNDDYANTIVHIPAGAGGIFKEEHTAVMKEVCTITATPPAKVILTDKDSLDHKGDVFMTVTHAGRGLVYANVDPWVYNEYTDGRKAPLGEDNFAGGLELTRWLVSEAVR